MKVAAAPAGFTQEGVNLEAPRLFENGFDIMFSRILKKISMGYYASHLSNAYREDIINLYMDVTKITQKCYNQFTQQYVLEEQILASLTYISMPKSVDYINDFSSFGDAGWDWISIESRNRRIQLHFVSI